MDLTQYTPETWIQNEEVLLNQLQNSSWKSFPLLNQVAFDSLKDGQIVRFVGMIQDMHSPEYYIESYVSVNNETQEKNIKSGKYIDFIKPEDIESVNFYGEDTVRKELHTFYAISTPAENQWVKDIERIESNLRVDTLRGNSQKRTLDEACSSSDLGTSYTNEDRSNSCKKHCTKPTNLNEKSNQNVPIEHLNFPIEDENGKACLIKVYNNEGNIKLNHIYEFIGFLSVNPRLSHESIPPEEYETDIEMQMHNPPPSLIPRIHCLCYKPLTHQNPLVDGVDLNNFKFMDIRKDLMILLTQLLLGDEVAAEYLLCHLISEVYIRKDLMALGKFSLNLSNIPVLENLNYVEKLYEFIQLLIPKSHYLPLTIENLNNITFVPKKDYESDRLVSGLLQLSANTSLVLDETKLQPGKLDQAGLGAVNSLVNLIKTQKMSYDFNYYPVEFDCDIPCLITSEFKSMLPSDCHVILKPEESHISTFNEVVEAAKHFLKPDLLNEIRKYLTLARMVTYKLGDNVQTLIQNKFVEMRQQGGNPDDLHNLLVLNRLICLSYGRIHWMTSLGLLLLSWRS
ncbi:hypothetical protein WA026_011422 [Henosepilachna vigintioctopunctata]|uniref:Mini-chromosome maintenance complex-binding protein n=1 Tax=Henosepilachna vigintioctopunctata TaxID=420089 RepID=A0AAW1TR51_9CUCU